MMEIKQMLEEYVRSDVEHGYNRYYERLVEGILKDYGLMKECEFYWDGYIDGVLDVLISYIFKNENRIIYQFKIKNYNEFSVLEKELLIEDIKCLSEKEVRKALK